MKPLHGFIATIDPSKPMANSALVQLLNCLFFLCAHGTFVRLFNTKQRQSFEKRKKEKRLYKTPLFSSYLAGSIEPQSTFRDTVHDQFPRITTYEEHTENKSYWSFVRKKKSKQGLPTGRSPKTVRRCSLKS